MVQSPPNIFFPCLHSTDILHFHFFGQIPSDILHFHFLSFAAKFIRYFPLSLSYLCCTLPQISACKTSSQLWSNLPPGGEQNVTLQRKMIFFVISIERLFSKYYIRPILSTMCAFTKQSNCETLFCKSYLTRTP